MSPTTSSFFEGMLREKLAVPWGPIGDPAPWFLSHLTEKQLRVIFERQLLRQRVILQHDLDTNKILLDTLKK